ncbi:MAG: VirB8/TrbF family protein [Gammaproteobacteria bacterium]|nr:VirB8/TrbF family protein [Gammaproteobacteria bacterium]
METTARTIGKLPGGLVKQLNPDNIPGLVVTNNRLLLSNLVLLLAFVCAVAYAVTVTFVAKNNEKLIYVKLAPDGTWFVDTQFAHKDETDFFPATIDHLLSSYVTRRFREDPATVRNDYGYALVLMDTGLAQYFKSPSGFDAAGKAAQIRACTNCSIKEVEVRNIYHFDIDRLSGGNPDDTTYRTNVYINELLRSSSDNTVLNSGRAIITLRWRLSPKSTLSRERNLLMANPIGLKIIEEKILDDPA